MPNYCNNNIVITGPNSVIDKIEKIANGDKGDLLQYFYPMPKALQDTTAPLQKDATKEEKAKAKENLKNMATTTGTIGELKIGEPNGILWSSTISIEKKLVRMNLRFRWDLILPGHRL